MAQVACVSCGAMVDEAKADITGRGYRCIACSLKASLAADGGHNDVIDHLTPAERVQKSKAAGSEMMVGAVTVFGGLLVLLIVPFPFHDVVGACIAFAGGGAISHGWLTRREMTGERTR
jgi:hypothetical protein